MVFYSTGCVLWPSTETFSLQLRVWHPNYTHCSGTQAFIINSPLFSDPHRVVLLKISLQWCSLPHRSDQCFVYLFIFRILVQICKTQAFQKLNPAQFNLHDAVNEAIQVSSGEDKWGYDISEGSSWLLTPDRYTGVVFYPKGFTSANDKGKAGTLYCMTF